MWALPSRHRYLLLETILRTVYQAMSSASEEEEVLQAAPNLLFLQPVMGEDFTTMQLWALLANSRCEDMQSSPDLHTLPRREV